MATLQKRQGKRGVRWRVLIRRRRQKAVTKTFRLRADAERWAREQERSIDLGRSMPGSEAHHRTLSELIDRYLDHLALDDQASGPRKKAQLEWWRSTIGHLRLAEIRPGQLAELRDLLMSDGGIDHTPVAGSTANRYLAALSVVLAYGVRELEWLDSSPAQKVRRGPEPRGRVRFLSEEELDTLLRAARESSDHRLYAIVRLAASSGMRKGEIERLGWSDINFKGRTALVHESKNNDRRAVPISGALDALRDLMAVRRIDDGRVFAPLRGQASWPEHQWKNARTLAGLEDFRFHDLRHTAASYLAMSGATLAEIAQILGHRTLAMVKRYAHLTEQHTVRVSDRMAAKYFGPKG